jgi:bloom syndrome protein
LLGVAPDDRPLKLGRVAAQFFAGRRKLQVVTKVGSTTTKAPPSAPAPRKKAKAKELPPSTNVSSPVRLTNKRRSVKSNLNLEDAEDDDHDDDGKDDDVIGSKPRHANGYAKDNFVVSDDDFESMRPPPKVRRQRKLQEMAAPISRESHAIHEDAATIDAIHADIIPVFVAEAMRLEEQIRNASGLRRVLFTQQHLRAMVVGWTESLDSMRQIPGINEESVALFGSKFIFLVRRYHKQYREMMGEGGPSEAAAEAGPSAMYEPHVVDLVSSDDEYEDDDQDEGLEASKYFAGPSSPPPQRGKEVQEWHQQLADRMSQGASQISAPQKSTPSGKGSWRSGKSFSRRGGKSSGGITKRRAASSGRKASAASVRSFSGGSNAAGRRGGSGRTGISRGGSGIGLMPI